MTRNIFRPSRSSRSSRSVRTGTATRRVLGAALAVGVLLIGSSSAADAAGSGGAWVRAAHLVPGLGTMSISLTPFQGSAGAQPSAAPGVTPAPTAHGMIAIAPTADYGSITEYRQVPAGFYTVAVRPADASPSSPPMITGTLQAKSGKAFTVAGIGTVSDPQVTTLADDLTSPPAGRARVRLLPAANIAKTVTVTARNGPTIARDAAFAEPTGYATVPAGTWKLQATGAGSTAGSSVTLAGGSVYTLLVLDSGKSLKITPVVDASGLDQMPRGGAQTGGGWLAEHGQKAAVDDGTARGLVSGALGAGAIGLALPLLARGRRRRPEQARSAPESS